MSRGTADVRQDAVQLVEVGPRDGFQMIGPFIPTRAKLSLIAGLQDAGVRRIEVTSFVSRRALPQFADAEQVLAEALALPGLDAQVLVPTARHAERALDCGATHLSFILSASEAHNHANLRRTVAQSILEFRDIVAMMPDHVSVRLNVATAFDCPYDGAVGRDALFDLLERLVAAAGDVEVALCDTTGRAGPSAVEDVFATALGRFPEVSGWAFHGHDTFGMGIANVLAAHAAGVRVFDASIAGLGGCPFAPGASGNVATEDVLSTFDTMGVPTGIALSTLLQVAGEAARLPGAG